MSNFSSLEQEHYPTHFNKILTPRGICSDALYMAEVLGWKGRFLETTVVNNLSSLGEEATLLSKLKDPTRDLGERRLNAVETMIAMNRDHSNPFNLKNTAWIHENELVNFINDLKSFFKNEKSENPKKNNSFFANFTLAEIYRRGLIGGEEFSAHLGDKSLEEVAPAFYEFFVLTNVLRRSGIDFLSLPCLIVVDKEKGKINGAERNREYIGSFLKGVAWFTENVSFNVKRDNKGIIDSFTFFPKKLLTSFWNVFMTSRPNNYS